MHTILITPIIYEALQRMLEEGYRHVSFARHLHPLYHFCLYKRDILHLIGCPDKEVQEHIMSATNRKIGCTENLIQLRRFNPGSIMTTSDIETANRALNRLIPSLEQHPVDETQFESALQEGANTLYEYTVRSMRRRQTQLEVQELIEKLLYIVPCGPTYSIRCSLWSERCYRLFEKFETEWLGDDTMVL